MKKSIAFIFAIIMIFGIVGCTGDDTTNNVQQNESSTIDQNNSISDVDNSSLIDDNNETKEFYENLFRNKYPKISELILQESIRENETVYTLNQGNIMFKITDTSVVYLNMEDNGFKAGAFFGEDPALTTQKKRLLVRDGFSSLPKMSLQEQYEIVISLLTEEEKIKAPSFEEFNNNLTLRKSGVGGRYLQYNNNELVIEIEESLKNGAIDARTIYYDVY